MLTGVRQALFNLVLTFFEEVNKQIHSRVHLWHMEKETEEHTKMLIRVFKLVILPASLFYLCSDYLFFGENALDSMLWGILIFIYSNFLPDLPSIYRRKKSNGTLEDLPWHKKYALLLFAPLFIWALVSGTRLRWQTGENFHNFRSLTIFTGFLLLLGFAFIYPPFSIGDITEIVSLPIYGLTGYLTHLKVDKIW